MVQEACGSRAGTGPPPPMTTWVCPWVFLGFLPFGILFSVDYVGSCFNFGLSSFPVSMSVCLLYLSSSGCLFLPSSVSPSRSLGLGLTLPLPSAGHTGE